MDKGEGDGAETREFHDHVLVFLYALHMAGVAGKGASGYAYVLTFLEISLAVHFAFCGVVGGEEFYETDFLVGDRLDFATFFIAVYP